VIPDSLRGQIIDISRYTKSSVRKVVCGTNHCLILFSDGQLAGFGGNEEGQLGFEMKKYGNYINEIKLNKFTNLYDPFTKSNIKENYEILDIAAGENFSLVLIRIKTRTLLVRLGIQPEDKYTDNMDNIYPVKIFELDYEKIHNIRYVYALGQRSLLITYNNDIYIGGVDFNLYPLEKYKHLEHFDKQIHSVHLGSAHCLILDCKNKINI
jgi:alpha-tubulin suppressor-like RCC1 family protein